MSDVFISRDSAVSDLLSAAAYLGERIRSGDGRAEAMNAVVPRFLARGEVDLAAELANSVDDPYSRDKLLTMVAEKCASIDDDEYAIQLADAIEDHGLRAQAFERIGLIKAGKGDLEKAAEVAASMEHPDFVLSAIAVFQASSAYDTAARATLEEIEFATARVSACLHIAGDRIQKEDVAGAVAWLDDAVASAEDIEHNEEKIRALCDIGNLFVEAGRNDKAIETYETARQFAETLENVHRDLFLATCALGFLNAGSQDLADRALDLVSDKTQMASAMLGFARHSWKAEKKEDAVEELEEAYSILRSQGEREIRDSRARNALLGSVAAQFAGFGKTERGVEVALENPDPSEQVGAITQIAQVLTFQGEDVLARETVNEIDDDSGRIAALVSVADIRIDRGNTEGATDLLNEAAAMSDELQQLASRSELLNQIASRFAIQGQTDLAVELASSNLALISEVRDESSRSVLLATLADIYEQANIPISDPDRERLNLFVRKADL